MSSAAYQPVGGLRNRLANGEDEEFQDEPDNNNQSRMEPLEMDNAAEHAHPEGNSDVLLLRQVNDCVVWPHLALAVTTWLVCPALAMAMVMAFQVTGRIWACALCALHLTLALIKARCHMNELAKSTTDSSKESLFPSSSYSDDAIQEEELETNNSVEEQETSGISRENAKVPPSKGFAYFCLTSLPSLMDILLFGVVYPVVHMFFNGFFVDTDGTLVYDWVNYYHGGQTIITMGWIIVASRVCFGGRMLLVGIPASTYYLTTTYYMFQSIPLLGKCFQSCYYHLWVRFKICFSSPPRPLICWKAITLIATLLSTLFLGWSIYSAVVHFGPYEPVPPDATNSTLCDPLDTTECCLPFPSSFHLKEDPTTDTGYRVNLNPEAFPSLKGRIPMSADFLNKLDGFSTMGPLLFYIEGMKESHEKYVEAMKKSQLTNQKEPGVTRLRGHPEIHLSITPYSTTLLLDIDEQVLVPHSAEIDYLDPERPLVMVFPAKPLKHNAHYAVAVINATDGAGNRLPPTPGMKYLWDQESERQVLFEKTVMPALERATHKGSVGEVNWGGPFGSFTRKKDPGALQLLFNFQTISKKSQIGPVRAVRDATLQHITKPEWKWKDHGRALRQIDGDCQNPNYPLARTIHVEIDVPWFLSGFGPGYRDAILDSHAVENAVPNTIGKAKFVVYVPCSLKRKALQIPQSGNMTAQPLRAVLEYGHGLFNKRDEAGDKFLIEMANREGYVIMAMDWRGMSQYDYPLILKTMLAKPSLFESIRDNLIQGYANKYAMQHFSSSGMLDREWFQFSAQDASEVAQPAKIPQWIAPDKTKNETQGVGPLPSVFYGISQGGILGAGYVSLSGATGLITRGVLGVPGTPFSLIMSRSLQFVGYDAALLMNFYDNRDVRIFLSLAQMCWDSVEGSGVLGQPVEEPVPPLLLQAGLGDPIVSTLAAERLARALGAQTLPHNPRGPLFGIPERKQADQDQKGPHATLTEILYQEDYEGLPRDDELSSAWNNVHLCVRLEPELQRQIDVFFTQDRIIDPCTSEGACVRKKAVC